MSKFIQEQKMPGVWNLNRRVKENMVSATRSPSEMLGVLPLNWEGRNVSCKGHWVGSDPPVTSIWGPCQALPLHALNVPWFLWLQSQEKFADQRHTEDKRGYDLAHVNSWEKNWVKREAKSPHHPWSPSWPFSVSQGCCPCSWVPQPVLWRQKLEGGHQGATPSGPWDPSCDFSCGYPGLDRLTCKLLICALLLKLVLPLLFPLSPPPPIFVCATWK